MICVNCGVKVKLDDRGLCPFWVHVSKPGKMIETISCLRRFEGSRRLFDPEDDCDWFAAPTTIEKIQDELLEIVQL